MQTLFDRSFVVEECKRQSIIRYNETSKLVSVETFSTSKAADLTAVDGIMFGGYFAYNGTAKLELDVAQSAGRPVIAELPVAENTPGTAFAIFFNVRTGTDETFLFTGYKLTFTFPAP